MRVTRDHYMNQPPADKSWTAYNGHASVHTTTEISKWCVMSINIIQQYDVS